MIDLQLLLSVELCRSFKAVSADRIGQVLELRR